MTGINRFYANTTGSPAFDFNQGPWHVPDLGKVLQVRFTGSFMVGLSSATESGFLFDNPTVWGVQYVHHGDSPLDVTGNGDDSRWLWNEQMLIGDWFTQLDASESTFNYGLQCRMEHTWNGQRPIGDDVDFYFSTKNPWYSGFSWNLGSTCEVITS